MTLADQLTTVERHPGRHSKPWWWRRWQRWSRGRRAEVRVANELRTVEKKHTKKLVAAVAAKQILTSEKPEQM
jgi:hypothetical protein